MQYQTADFNHNDFDQSQQSEVDKTLLVKFYLKSVQNQAKSKAENRPVFVEKTYIDIKTPGSRDGAARPATMRDKQRFPQHFAAFEQRMAMPVEGTPLCEWPLITRSMAEEMSFMNIKTVEQLADLNDGLAGKFMGAMTFKQKAKKWLEQAAEGKMSTELQEIVLEQDTKLKAMAVQIDELKELLAAAPKPRKSRAKPKAMPVDDPSEE